MDERPECKLKTIKLLEKNIKQKLHDTGFDNNFLDMTPNTQVTIMTSKI
jgi:hypothetical protein